MTIIQSSKRSSTPAAPMSPVVPAASRPATRHRPTLRVLRVVAIVSAAVLLVVSSSSGGDLATTVTGPSAPPRNLDRGPANTIGADLSITHQQMTAGLLQTNPSATRIRDCIQPDTVLLLWQTKSLHHHPVGDTHPTPAAVHLVDLDWKAADVC